MGNVGVVTDSSACLPSELVAGLGIHVVPLRFFIDGKSYLDGIDITATDVYRMMPGLSQLPTTSAPTPGDYYAAMERVARTHESILVITIGRRFSGMYQSAMLAAGNAREALGPARVEVFDSGTAAGAEGLVVLEAARAAAAGKSLDDVVAAAGATASTVSLVAILDTLYYLARSGRVPMAVHWANSVIRVNPVFRILPVSGEVKTVRVARGRESGVRQMLELVQRDADGRTLRVAVFHSDRIAEAQSLAESAGTRLSCAELYISDFTPAMGIHSGPGVLGLAYCATV